MKITNSNYQSLHFFKDNGKRPSSAPMFWFLILYVYFSISRSPKNKSKLDLLPRPPLHEHERQDTTQVETAEGHSSTDEDAMEMDVKVIDDDITFNFKNANSEEGKTNLCLNQKLLQLKILFVRGRKDWT